MDDPRSLSVLFLAPIRHLGTMAFGMESVAGFALRGHRVDVLTSSLSSTPLHFDHGNIGLYWYPDHQYPWRKLYLAFFRHAFWLCRQKRYDLLVGLSEMGLIAAHSLHKRYGMPYVYFADELHMGNERNNVLGRLYGVSVKCMERLAHSRAFLTVTLDPWHGRLLAKVNSASRSTLRYLPNSRAGSAGLAESYTLHDCLGIPRDGRIVLWTGLLRPGDGALDLAQSTAHWPADLWLVFHFLPDRRFPYKQAIAACDRQGQTRVSTRPVPYDEFPDLAASASVGLGLCEDVGPNIRWMGYSCGKVNFFLKMGIPCIVNRYPGFRWLEKAGAGRCVGSPSDVLRRRRHPGAL